MTSNPLSVKLEGCYRGESCSEKKLSPPSGMCFTTNGNILLADDFNHRIQIYDPEYKLINSFGSKGKQSCQFQYPKGIAVDSQENIYVADCWNHRIQKFDSQGTPLFSFGTCGDGQGELNEPYDILVEPSGNIIVVERYNHRIQFFNSHGESLGWIGTRGTVLEEQLAKLLGTPANILGPLLFELPTSIAKDSKGNYFITDSGNHRIRRFNSQWQETASFGEKGSESGQFQYPLCAAIAPNDLLYIADLNNERIQVFSSFGQYLFKIDSSNSKQSIEAPCLTKIDEKGCLHVGFTFQTAISKFLVPIVSQNSLVEKLVESSKTEPAFSLYQALSREQGNLKPLSTLNKTFVQLTENKVIHDGLRMDASLAFSRLVSSETIDSTFELACHASEEELNEVRNQALKYFSDWQEVVSKFIKLLHDEQRETLRDPNGIRDFNRDLHVSEQEDKKFYRLTQQKFFLYQKRVQQFSQIIYNLINKNLPETHIKSLHQTLLRQIEEALTHLKENFEQKETIEESMVKLLGESQGEKDKLSDFLTDFYSNSRVMDLQRNLQFELHSHWFNLKILAEKSHQNLSLENLAGKKSGDPSAFKNIIRLLIGFHEDWPTLLPLEQKLTNTLDAFLNIHPSIEKPCKKDLTIGDFSTISYETENLDFDGVFGALKSESLPLTKQNETLIWGQDEYQFPGFSENQAEIANSVFNLLEAQSVYREKSQDLIQQLDELSQNRKALETQLKQTHVEDKVSPITINNNISIVQFQINLIRRMLMSLDINQSLNLHRLVLAGAFLSMGDKNNSKVQKFIKFFDDYYSQINQTIRQIAKSRKDNTFKLSDLNNQASEIASKYDILEISDSIKNEEEIELTKIILDRLEFEYQRTSRIKNSLDKLNEFFILSPATILKDTQEIQVIEKGGAEIGQTLAPQGIHHNCYGNLLITDYENHKVYSYSKTGKYQFQFGGWGNAPTCLQYPTDLATDSESSIFVINELTREIKKFDSQGNFLLQFGHGDFGPIFSLSIDSNDHLWVAESEQNRIRAFDNEGNFLRTISGDAAKLNQPVSVYCLPNGEFIIGDKSDSLLKQLDSEGRLIRETSRRDLGVDEIYFLTWHPKYGIFGSDFWNSQIAHLNNKFEVQNIHHKPGRRSGQFGKVGGLSIFNDKLAVANFDGCKVQILDLSSLKPI